MKFKVGGMSCAACSARVEKAVKSVLGVTDCSVNLLTGDLIVSGSVSCDEIVSAVIDAGYSILENFDEKQSRKTSSIFKKRLLPSIILLIILMYFSMGHMFNLPMISFFKKNIPLLALVQLCLALAVMIINKAFFINGFKGAIKGAANMDTLVALGSFAAFAYSTAMTVKIFTANNVTTASSLLHGLYFESAAMILTLITVGKLLETKAKGKTGDAIDSLRNLAPKFATVIEDGKEKTVPINGVLKGDIFIVRPSQSIAADGVVIKGESAVDESALTGESIPCDKTVGSRVSQGTINKTGVLVCKATADANFSSIERIIEMVKSTVATKAPIARIADRVSGVFVPVVIVISVITFICWMLVNGDLGFALNRAISVLVISCPCALGLATPVAIMVGSGVAAKNSILFKNATALELCGKSKTVVLDKTGTITMGVPKVCDVILIDGVDTNELLSVAKNLEKGSLHPLAKAVFEYASEKFNADMAVEQFKEHSGCGVEAIIDNEFCFAGNLKFVQDKISVPTNIINQADEMSCVGKTPLFFGKRDKFLGIIAVSDSIKPDSATAISKLKKLGCDVWMLTGDNQKTAEFVANQVGINNVLAGVLPENKAETINKLKENGDVIMVGDGINDAIALAGATTGIALGSGTDVSIDSADVVLMGENLMGVVKAISISKATLKIIKQNMFWAFFYNCLGIPLASGVFIPLFNIGLNPMFAAAAMSISSFCVIANALRLNFINFHPKEKFKMKKTINIQGMMCPHCSAHVQTALEALGEVESAQVSHQSGQAIVCLSADIPDDQLKVAVEKQGYTVISIE